MMQATDKQDESHLKMSLKTKHLYFTVAVVQVQLSLVFVLVDLNLQLNQVYCQKSSHILSVCFVLPLFMRNTKHSETKKKG